MSRLSANSLPPDLAASLWNTLQPPELRLPKMSEPYNALNVARAMLSLLSADQKTFALFQIAALLNESPGLVDTFHLLFLRDQLGWEIEPKTAYRFACAISGLDHMGEAQLGMACSREQLLTLLRDLSTELLKPSTEEDSVLADAWQAANEMAADLLQSSPADDPELAEAWREANPE